MIVSGDYEFRYLKGPGAAKITYYSRELASGIPVTDWKENTYWEPVGALPLQHASYWVKPPYERHLEITGFNAAAYVSPNSINDFPCLVAEQAVRLAELATGISRETTYNILTDTRAPISAPIGFHQILEPLLDAHNTSVWPRVEAAISGAAVQALTALRTTGDSLVGVTGAATPILKLLLRGYGTTASLSGIFTSVVSESYGPDYYIDGSGIFQATQHLTGNEGTAIGFKGPEGLEKPIGTRRVGLNIASPSTNATAWMYVNWCKNASSWELVNITGAYYEEKTLDTSGYLTSVPSGTFGYSIVQQDWNGHRRLTGVVPTGEYLISFDGEGLIRVYTDSALTEYTDVTGSPTVFNSNNGYIVLSMLECNSGDYIRNLDIREAKFAGEDRKFYQEFLEHVSGFSPLRMHTWYSDSVYAGDTLNWADRITTGYYSYTVSEQMYTGGALLSPRHMPFEDVIELCNSVGSDAWVMVPWKTEADYWSGFISLIATELNGHCFVEYSNETWHAPSVVYNCSGLYTYGLSIIPTGYPTGMAQFYGYASKASAVFRQIKTQTLNSAGDLFGPSKVTKFTTAASFNQSGFLQMDAAMAYQDEDGYYFPHYIDLVCTHGYWGYPDSLDVASQTEIEEATALDPDAYLTAYAFPALTESISGALAIKNHAQNRHGIRRFGIYEGGYFFTVGGASYDALTGNPLFSEWESMVLAATRSTRQQYLHSYFLNRMDYFMSPGDPLCYYESCAPYYISRNQGICEDFLQENPPKLLGLKPFAVPELITSYYPEDQDFRNLELIPVLAEASSAFPGLATTVYSALITELTNFSGNACGPWGTGETVTLDEFESYGRWNRYGANVIYDAIKAYEAVTGLTAAQASGIYTGITTAIDLSIKHYFPTLTAGGRVYGDSSKLVFSWGWLANLTGGYEGYYQTGVNKLMQLAVDQFGVVREPGGSSGQPGTETWAPPNQLFETLAIRTGENLGWISQLAKATVLMNGLPESPFKNALASKGQTVGGMLRALQLLNLEQDPFRC